MTELIVDNLSRKAGRKTLFENVSFSLRPGELTILLGPNGAGKSSLVKTIIGYGKANSGSVRLGETDIRSMSISQRAEHIAYLPQIQRMAWPISVRDAISLGRYARQPEKMLEQILNKIADDCNLTHLMDRTTDTLSGGELARVHCARLFAAETSFIIADEPIAALDPAHQFYTLNIFREFCRKGGSTLVILHDIALAARYADRLIWMKDGRVITQGPTKKTLTPEIASLTYGLKLKISNGQVLLFPENQ